MDQVDAAKDLGNAAGELKTVEERAVMNQHYLNKEEAAELDDLSITLCYQAIKFSQLWKLLDNSDADKFALELSEDIRARVGLKIDQKVEQAEAERAKEAA